MDSLKILDRLKNATIVNYYDSVNPDYDLDLYDKMFNHLVKGDFNNEFYSSLDDLSYKEKDELMNKALKYINLCFYLGNPTYWTDSIEGVGVLDLDYLSEKILDNYNFLIEVLKEYGEEPLDGLVSLEGASISNESAIIDYLRNTFNDDEALKVSLARMYKRDGMYSGLDTSVKENFLKYPLGVIYTYAGDDVVLSSRRHLLHELLERSGVDDVNITKLSDLACYLGDNRFNNLVRDMYFEYDGVKNNYSK